MFAENIINQRHRYMYLYRISNGLFLLLSELLKRRIITSECKYFNFKQ